MFNLVFVIGGVLSVVLFHLIAVKSVLSTIDEAFGSTQADRYFGLVLYIFGAVSVFMLWPVTLVLLAGFFVFRYFDGRKYGSNI